MAINFHIGGLEVTQGLQYYHCWHHLDEFADRYPDNALPLIAEKRTWVRAYIESDSAYTADVDGTIWVHSTRSGVTRHFGPLKARATCKPYEYGTKTYDAIRSTLAHSLNFDLPWDWVSGEMRIYVKATDGKKERDAAVWVQAPMRQTLKLAGIMAGSKTIPAPDLEALKKTAWKARRALPVSHNVDFRVVGNIQMSRRLSEKDDSWSELHDKATGVRQNDGNRPDFPAFG
jgi:hypothetical protein